MPRLRQKMLQLRGSINTEFCTVLIYNLYKLIFCYRRCIGKNISNFLNGCLTRLGLGVGLAFAGLVNAYGIAVYFTAVFGVVGVGDGAAAGVAKDADGVLAALLYQVINCSKQNSCMK